MTGNVLLLFTGIEHAQQRRFPWEAERRRDPSASRTWLPPSSATWRRDPRRRDHRRGDVAGGMVVTYTVSAFDD
jgi:hypothetical protein